MTNAEFWLMLEGFAVGLFILGALSAIVGWIICFIRCYF
jgi:hypothetical protein